MIDIIRLFKVAPRPQSESESVPASMVNHYASKCGYIVHPDCCTQDTLEFVQSQRVNYNSTFYKQWEDITNSTRANLWIDQLTHYASTYGTDYTGTPYVPNDNDPVPFTNYTVILPASREEIYKKCLEMMLSGIALSSNTIDVLVNYVIPYCKENQVTINIDEIKNKEAQAVLSGELNIWPTDKFALLRCIIYQYTGNCMLIKDKETIQIMRWKNVDLSFLTEQQMKSLSEIFYRFKPLFLAMRSGLDNKKIINKIRRMAKKNHQPFVAGFWETVLAQKDYKVTKKVAERVHELSNFKLVQLIQATRERLIASNVQAPQLYNIRNGKVFAKEKNYPMLSNEIYYWETILEIFVGQLVENLKKKACTVKFPEHLVLACPSSEKNFVGNLPFGSRFKMEDNNYIGIYWRNEWGTRDFDLSAIDVNGNKVGWNAHYKTDGLIYSGDMTDANPEATEILHCRKSCEDSIIKVNRYNGEDGSKFELIYGSETGKIQPNYMINPDTLMLREEIISNSTEKMVGAIIDGNMCLMDMRVGNSIVSNSKNDFINILRRKFKCFINLKEILMAAGFKERKRDTKNNPIELDLTNLNKDTLIELFS